MDSLSDKERYEEINCLQFLSLQIQSLLYEDISKSIKSFPGNYLIPLTFKRTEISLLADISASMTTLSPSKLNGAQFLSTGITSVFSSFGILINMYVFANREAIWQLSDLSHSTPFLDFLHLAEAIPVGEGPSSYPLDALLTYFSI
jgi:hypothetical protein